MTLRETDLHQSHVSVRLLVEGFPITRHKKNTSSTPHCLVCTILYLAKAFALVWAVTSRAPHERARSVAVVVVVAAATAAAAAAACFRRRRGRADAVRGPRRADDRRLERERRRRGTVAAEWCEGRQSSPVTSNPHAPSCRRRRLERRERRERRPSLTIHHPFLTMIIPFVHDTSSSHHQSTTR